MKNKIIGAFVCLSVVTLVSCGSLSESDCLAIDWEAQGLEDGLDGEQLSIINETTQACGEFGVEPDMEAYQRGRDQGISVYCQAENGFQLGRSGAQYKGVCPLDMSPAFLKEYDEGVEFYYVDQGIQEVERARARGEDAIVRLQRQINNGYILLEGTTLSTQDQIRMRQDIRSWEDQINDYERSDLMLEAVLAERIEDLRRLKEIYDR